MTIMLMAVWLCKTLNGHIFNILKTFVDQFQERSEPCSRFVITERNVDFVYNESVFLVFNASKVSSCVDICHRTVYCNAFVARHSDGVVGCRLSFYTAGTRYGLGSDLWERVEL